MKCSQRPPRLLPKRTALIVLLALELACGKKQVAVPAPPHSIPAQPAAESGTPAAPAIPRNPAASSPQQSPQPAPQPATPQPAQAPAPQLGDIVTPDAQRQYNAAIEQSLARAQASLAAIGNRPLNRDQQGLVEQIRKLIAQARAARTSDLPGAKSLAQRAEVLAKDLAAGFR